MNAAADSTSIDSDLFKNHQATAYRVAYRILGNDADAHDAVQNAYMKVLRTGHHHRGQSSVKTWLLRIVTNAAYDLGRRNRRQINHFQPCNNLDNFTTRTNPPEEMLIHQDRQDALTQAIDQLPQAQRQTVQLQLGDDLTYSEVAQRLGISIGTVMSRLFYARNRLRELLHVQGVD